MIRKIYALLAVAFVALALQGCKDPGWPPQTTEAQAHQAITAARENLMGRPAHFPQVTGKAFFLVLYDENNQRKSTGSYHLAEIAGFLPKYAKTPEALEKTTMTFHVILSTSKIRIRKFAELGWTYEKGLQGLAFAKDGKTWVLDGPYIAARNLSVAEAEKILRDGGGTAISKFPISNGLHAVTMNSFTEVEPGGRVAPLYRANIMDDKATPEALRDVILNGAYQLARLQKGSGKFFYEYFPSTDKRNKRTYNLLRHAGSCYSLFQSYSFTGHERFLKAGNRGLEWLEKTIQTPEWDKDRAYPVYHNKAKLGGAALTLMAYCERAKVSSDAQVSPLMHKLANHLIEMQNPNGSFESYYSWNQKPVKRRHSIYYPGESILALTRLYKLDPKREDALAAAKKGADYLVNERWMIAGLEVNVPPDAWLMMALNELWEITRVDAYREYCLRIADVMASDQHVKFLPDQDYFGGYFPDPPQVTPAGSRLEGLTAAYWLAKNAGDDAGWILDTIRRGALFQSRMQIRPHFAHLFPNPKMAMGTFRHSPVETRNRIDYNQHNISGLIEAVRILESL